MITILPLIMGAVVGTIITQTVINIFKKKK
jgi:hypothetical protein